MRLPRMDAEKLWFLVLTLLTVIFMGMIIAHTIDYRRYVEETTKYFLDKGFDYEFIEGVVDFLPWSGYAMGPWTILLGLVTVHLWIASLIALIAQAKMARLETLERETSTTT